MQTPISQLLPHPDACSHPAETILRKLAAHIRATGLYPPLIVRTLTRSKKFHAHAGRLQIIDGHLRLCVLKKLGHAHVQVHNFGPLTDKQTELLLLTLNHLKAHADPQKRAKLIKRHLHQHRLTIADLQKLLPDSKTTLQRLLDLIARQPKLTTPKPPADQPKPFALFLSPQQHQLLQTALTQARKSQKSLPNALTHLAEHYLKNHQPLLTNPHPSLKETQP